MPPDFMTSHFYAFSCLNIGLRDDAAGREDLRGLHVIYILFIYSILYLQYNLLLYRIYNLYIYL